MITNIEKHHHRFAHSSENIAIVSENIAEDPNVSDIDEYGSLNYRTMYNNYQNPLQKW